MAVVKTLEEDLKALGLLSPKTETAPGKSAAPAVETTEDVDDDADEGTEIDMNSAEFRALPLSEQIRIKRHAKRRKRRPKKRLGAAVKAKMRISARKRRRTASGRKLSKIRGKAMKLAKKRGLRPGQISIMTQGKDVPNGTSVAEGVQTAMRSRIASLLEDLESLGATLTVEDEVNELREAFENVGEVASLLKAKYEGVQEDLSASDREEVKDILEAIEEIVKLSARATQMVLEGHREFENEEGHDVSLNDVLEDMVEDLQEYAEALEDYEQEV